MLKAPLAAFWLCCFFFAASGSHMSASGLSRHDPIDDSHLPQFFVVGGQKCGTSSIWEYLKDHPQFVPPAKKENFIFAK